MNAERTVNGVLLKAVFEWHSGLGSVRQLRCVLYSTSNLDVYQKRMVALA